MAVIAIDSLSYPPPTERMICDGIIAIIAAAITAELDEPKILTEFEFDIQSMYPTYLNIHKLANPKSWLL